MSKNSTIEIKIGAVELTCRGTVDRSQLEDVLRTIRSELPELMATGQGAAAPTAGDLLSRANTRTFGDKAGVIAFWLEEYQGRRDWRSGDIVAVMQDLGEATPANITDTLNQRLKKGLLEVHDRRWQLTGEGRGWVKYHLLGLADDSE